MARVKINDIPLDHEVSQKELKKVMGGGYFPTQTSFEPLAGSHIQRETYVLDDFNIGQDMDLYRLSSKLRR